MTNTEVQTITNRSGLVVTPGMAVSVKGSAVPRKVCEVYDDGQVRVRRTDGSIVSSSVWSTIDKLVAR